MADRKKILIVGGGYGGLACLRGLAAAIDRDRYSLALMDSVDYHAIKTRFHERAVLSSRELGLRVPLTWLAAASGAELIVDRAVKVDVERKKVIGSEGEYPFDLLELSIGARAVYFGIPGAEENSVHLQNYESAAACAEKLARLVAESSDGFRRHVVVVGGGIEGIEVAAQISHQTRTESIAVTVVERAAQILAASSLRMSGRVYALEALRKRGVRFLLGKALTGVEAQKVILEDGSELASHLTLWCSGQRPADLDGLGVEGPLKLDRTLRHTKYPWLFGLGDFVVLEGGDQAANLNSAQRAVYHGKLAARNIMRAESGRQLLPADYRPAGEMIALGDTDGVGLFFGVEVRGLKAAAMKKLNETRYLAMLAKGMPLALAKSLVAGRGG